MANRRATSGLKCTKNAVERATTEGFPDTETEPLEPDVISLDRPGCARILEASLADTWSRSPGAYGRE
jgi:hypothetical protein